MRKPEDKPARIVAALDTETHTIKVGDVLRSLPVCYQICYTGGPSVTEVEDIGALPVEIIREQDELAPALVPIVRDGMHGAYLPVVAVHNLGYDLRFLMDYLDVAYEGDYVIDCCFKSSLKPLTVTVKRGRDPLICFWDTLAFSGMSLARMGEQCGCAKQTGKWDYQRARHAGTALDESEMLYASEDCHVLLTWLKFWISLNPEVPERALARRVLTKTSVVRYKCRDIAARLTIPVSRGRADTAYNDYLRTCKNELPEDEASYSLMIRSTSAGWTFTASRGAGRAWDRVLKYDAVSMHPSHMVSHYYPRRFERVTDPGKRQFVFYTCCGMPVEKVLAQWARPFPFAFNARVRFTGLRLRPGTVFERDGVALHGTGLFSDYQNRFADLDDESSNMEFNRINANGYANYTLGGLYLFGKLIAADTCVISLNEINAWVHSRVYTWETCEVLDMTATANFRKVPAYIPICVSEMLERKQTVKRLMHGEALERPEWMPANAYDQIRADPHAQASKDYYGLVKADLNSLYGMFATNEFKETIVYNGLENTFDYDGVHGFANAPERPKAWYNFGMRVAAFSRLQQCIALELVYDMGLAECVVNGDTDSFAFQSAPGVTHADLMETLEPLHDAIARSIEICGNAYHVDVAGFAGLGAYEVDCEPDLYCAVANKRYAYLYDNRAHLHVASAGVPTASIRRALTYEMQGGCGFSEATIKAMGYEVEYVGALSGTKVRAIPRWGERLGCSLMVEDHAGELYEYPPETCVGIALTNTSKALGVGFDADYQWCCANAGILPSSPRHYEMVWTGELDEAGEKLESLEVW